MNTDIVIVLTLLYGTALEVFLAVLTVIVNLLIFVPKSELRKLQKDSNYNEVLYDKFIVPNYKNTFIILNLITLTLIWIFQ